MFLERGIVPLWLLDNFKWRVCLISLFVFKTNMYKKDRYNFKICAFIELKLSKVNLMIEMFIRAKDIRNKEDKISSQEIS